ncbi:peptidoglycan-binding protein [Embleya hyalina]|uniref:Hydrolase n=1 Tax=Embleya hyalina TaxID=516124 RepID=A0A401YVJ2_9ACTN|nr:peptidoglycan-binding protein [Embleya hyalina]GCD98591.1 hydrolase [Embleya hyalina]
MRKKMIGIVVGAVVVAGGTANAVPTTPSFTTVANASGSIDCPDIHRGSRGDCVRELQRELNATGAALAVDGIAGPQTVQAVIDFQKRHALTPDGIVGPATRKALIDALSVATPRLRQAHYPQTFKPTAAAEWARAHSQDFTGLAAPCTEFVSRAMLAAGMPPDAKWYPPSDGVGRYVSGYSRSWDLAVDLREYLLSNGWVDSVALDARNPRLNASVGRPGDIVFYWWNGRGNDQHVHVAMVVGVDNAGLHVADQGGTHLGNSDRLWNISYVHQGNPLLASHPGMQAVLLHWK